MTRAQPATYGHVMHTAQPTTDDLVADLRALIVASDTTAAAIAEQLGHDPAWLSRRLNGHLQFTVREVEKIAQLLGATFTARITS